jgi:tetratricopeptide (TPR) repeat protein
MFRGLPFVVAVVFACGVLASAAAVDPKQLYVQSTDAMYNLDFSTAQHGYETLTQDYPDNPDYWNALASSIWLKITLDQQKLNLESFSGRSTFGTKESHEKLNPEDEKRLRDTIKIAIDKADAILKKNPNDVRALYAKGNSNATLATFEATVKRSYLNANSSAQTAKKLHQQVLKLDPSFDDARISIGTYDYVVGVIPSFVKVLISLFGVSGAGKEAGIQQLQLAAAKGKFASTDAKMVLAVIYSRERRYDDALRMMNDLHAKYPRNFLFELAKASTYSKMKRFDDAVHTYEQVLDKVQSKKDGYEHIRAEKIYFSLATSNVDRNQFETAVEDFSRVVAGKNATPDEKAMSYLWMGKIFDTKKDRPRAVQQYDAVLGLDCGSDLKDEALRYKRRPFGDEK